MKPILLFSLLITVIQGFGQVDAGISSVNSPSGNICPGSITPSVTLENFGGTTLTAVDILYNIDGAPNSSYSWSGSLTPGGAVNVTLPNLSSTVGTHTFNAVTNSPNGTTDGNTLNDDGTENFTITPAINYTATVSNSNCGATDGSILINASGGTGTLQYSVNAGITFQGSNSFINLGLGAYNVVIEDANGCQTLGIENVLSNGGPSIVTININQPTCFGTNDGSIVIAANGGGLTYSIDGGANYATTSPETLGFFQNIAPGSYSVYIKDSSGCETFQVVTLSQPDQINTLIFGNNAGCGTSNGSASVLATGGDGNFSYLWDDASNQASSSASNIPAGLYHVTVTDGNFCSVVDSVFIGNNGGPSISLASSNTICYNDPSGQISTNVSGGTAPYTYLWDDGTNQTTAIAVGLNVGTYLCQVFDNNGCVAFGNASVNEPELLTGNLSVIQASCGNNNGLIISTISGGTSPYTYQWNDGNNQTTSVAVSLPAGQYTVDVTDANGCIFSN
ncbi:MAG: SprB repeat-containing protein, partial [Bacteroidetes bacterium]|nr:SprB repeat-containing protein [Bacteroidota bacterium]